MTENTRRGMLLASASAVTAACARPMTTTSRTSEAAPSQPPLPLTYWKSLSGPRHDAQVQLVDAFNTAQDRVRVTPEHQGEYNALSDKLRIALASGAPPDVAMLGTNADMPAFARLGVLQPLDSFARADKSFHLDEIAPGFVRDSRVSLPQQPGAPANGALFQLPFARSTPLLYANLDQLRTHGLPEALPTTWPAFLDVAQRLVRARRNASRDGEAVGPVASPAVGPFAYGAGTSWWEFQPMLWAFGGAFSDAQRRVRIDAPASIEAMQFLADLVYRHRVTLPTKNAQAAFLRGEIALLTSSSANLTQIEESASFRAGVAPVPGHRDAAVPGGGAGLSLLQAAPRRAKEHGWRFLTFMTSTESTAFFAQATGYSPVRPAAHADPRLATALDRSPNARIALAQIDRVRPVDAILAAPFANKRIEEALEAILFHGASVPDTCAHLASQLRQAADAA